MIEEARLGGLVVVGAHLKSSVSAEFSGQTSELDRLSGGVRPRGSDDRHATSGLFDYSLDDIGMLSMRKGGGLTGRTARHQTVTPDLLDVVVNQLGDPGEVDAQIFLERSDERNDDPS